MNELIINSIVSDIQEYSTICLLNSIVQTLDGELYLLIYTTEELQMLESVYVNKETLTCIPKKGLLTNFLVKDDFLRCDNLPKIKVNMKSDDLLGKKNSMSFRYNSEDVSFFSFLSNASNFIYVDETALEPNEDVELAKYKLGVHGYTSFTNLKFSETTMTAYLHVITQNGLENRNIVFLNDRNYLQVNEFIVGVKGLTPNFPEACAEYFGDAVNSEGEILNLYRIKMLSLYDDVSFAVDTNLINLCCYKSLCLKNALNMLDVIINSIVKQDSDTLKWSGGTNSHKSDFGVLFKSSGESFSKNRCEHLLDTVMKGYVVPAMVSCDVDTPKEEIYTKVLSELMNSGVTVEEKYLRKIIANIMILSSDKESILANACKYRKQFQSEKFTFDKFLYWIRCYLYLNKRRITMPGNPLIYSNFINAHTLVTEGTYYGEDR